MFSITDIRRIQESRPDLTYDQAAEVLGFLNDVYAVEPYDIKDTDKLFRDTAGYVFPEVNHG